jgi:hypothetical protein
LCMILKAVTCVSKKHTQNSGFHNTAVRRAVENEALTHFNLAGE